MANAKLGSSFSCSAPFLSYSPFQNTTSAQLTGAHLQINAEDKSCQHKFKHGIPDLKGTLQKQHNALFVVSEDQSQYCEVETTALVPENNYTVAEDVSPASNLYFHLSGSDGKPGLISFYTRPYGRESKLLLPNSEKSQKSILWFLGPAVLVATSFFLHSIYAK